MATAHYKLLTTVLNAVGGNPVRLALNLHNSSAVYSSTNTTISTFNAAFTTANGPSVAMGTTSTKVRQAVIWPSTANTVQIRILTGGGSFQSSDSGFVLAPTGVSVVSVVGPTTIGLFTTSTATEVAILGIFT